MLARKLPLATFLTVALVAADSYACGPFFPNYLLENRNANLLYLPEGSFDLESSRLVPIDPRLPQWRDTSDDKLSAPSAQDVLLKEIRASGSVEAAEKMAADLPIASRLYVLGAVAFSTYDSRARDYFRQVLALPAEQQDQWGLKARYSLARDLMGDYPAPRSESGYPLSSKDNSHGNEQELREAFELYQQIIDAVRNGQEDPEQLSLASLGQQGRIKHWQSEPLAAAHLYAQQAAQGSPTGSLSLRYTADILSHPENENFLQPGIDDPVIQQLLIASFFTRSSNSLYEPEPRPYDEKEIKNYHDALIAKLAQKVNHDMPGSDRLIALAYRNGQYPLVTLMLKNAKENGLTSWVQAKMALRAGDVKAATAWYAKAAASFPANEAWGSPQPDNNEIVGDEFVIPSCRINAEQAILALDRNDYLEAMRLMYKAKESYWPDLAHIAEQVLTLKELTAFVDKYVPAPAPSLLSQQENAERYSADARLRTLLARRLMRAGQYQKALTYFALAENRDAAQAFINTLAKNGPKTAQAKAWWQAAQILRYQGMELTGYEMAPDFALYEGWYSWPYYSWGPEADPTIKSWISAGERHRVLLSQPKKYNFFMHYRWQAVKLAEKSADLLPRKSQAYAAVLCNATSWIWAQDPASVKRLYKRYVKNGAPFPWAENFGQNCPEPNFATLGGVIN
ncbi:hypothetical protein [Klebsiella spallanzanii]|uniref:hypothetical protein n=1 Tax=Klebsiella spallanzanii TaxID=2587528 RepID=UPI0025972185|nr:hypothetical protein [Klebsiella spallanzanii]MDM4206017.1 hypothetical protein [Klebsiella spallanzanii]